MSVKRTVENGEVEDKCEGSSTQMKEEITSTEEVEDQMDSSSMIASI